MDRSMEGEDEGGSEIIKGSQEQEGGGRGSVIKSYECTFCKRGFSNAQALGGHMNIHRKDKAKLKQSSNQLPLPLPHHHHQQSNSKVEDMRSINKKPNWKLLMELDDASSRDDHHPHRHETTSSQSLLAVHIRKLPLFSETPNCGEEGDQIDDDDGDHEKGFVASAGQGSSSSDLDLELRLGPDPPPPSPTRKFF